MLSITRSLVSKAPAAGSKSSSGAKPQKMSMRWNSSSTNGKKEQKDWVGTVHEKKNIEEEPALSQATKVNLGHNASKVKGGEDASKRAEEVTKAKSSDSSESSKSKKSSSKSSQSPYAV